MPETTTLEPVLRLRAAIEALRTAASAATPGDWTAHLLPPNEHHSHPAHWVKTEYDDANTTTSQVVADCPWRQADAAWIALMRPAVGLAIAAWLEHKADMAVSVARHRPDAATESAPWLVPALALADALLAAATP